MCVYFLIVLLLVDFQLITEWLLVDNEKRYSLDLRFIFSVRAVILFPNRGLKCFRKHFFVSGKFCRVHGLLPL